MTRTPCVTSRPAATSKPGTASEELFLPARLELARRCPARGDYLDLVFATAEGRWDWCFPKPPPEPAEPDGPLALVIGPYGVQIHRLRDGELGPRISTAAGLALILAGAEIWIARRLVRPRSA